MPRASSASVKSTSSAKPRTGRPPAREQLARAIGDQIRARVRSLTADGTITKSQLAKIFNSNGISGLLNGSLTTSMSVALGVAHLLGAQVQLSWGEPLIGTTRRRDANQDAHRILSEVTMGADALTGVRNLRKAIRQLEAL